MIRILIWLLSQPVLWAGLGVTLGPYFFWRGFRLLQRKRLIMDTPRSTIRAAAMGCVEISGRAVGPYTLVAPMSHTDCFYYRLVIESNPEGDLRKRIQEMCAPLFLDDGTGTLMIFPHGSELQMQPSSERSEYGKLAFALTRYSEGTPEFAQEYCIKPGDTIFVLGTLRENPWAKKNPVAEGSELSRIGPGFVGRSEAELLRCEAYPYLDSTLPAGGDLAPLSQFDLHPPVILMQGEGHFVISTDSQKELVARLNLKSLLYIWGGPVAALWGLWEILNRAGVL
ncbi:MAG TPA: hypothetical protein VNX26_12815 [Candidatus Acidoferrum sp.]|jgi:hypothetical protein|nr:hypothetical protein [Candidatus Acidoferrum sp.]